MGLGPSVDLSVPPGGSMIILQSPAECIQTRPRFTETLKPPCLSIDDSAWKGFVTKLTSIVNGYWNELIPLLVVPVGLVLMFGTWIVEFAAEVDVPFFVGFFVALATVLSAFGGRAIVVSKNCTQDAHIQQVCREIGSATHGAVSVQYRTAWTGFCKPRHVRTARLIVFCPTSAMPAVGVPVQSVMVTVPAGVQPGQVLQIQTPMGIQNATVPAGVAPGETFIFTPPTAATAAPLLVQADVVVWCQEWSLLLARPDAERWKRGFHLLSATPSAKLNCCSLL